MTRPQPEFEAPAGGTVRPSPINFTQPSAQAVSRAKRVRERRAKRSLDTAEHWAITHSRWVERGWSWLRSYLPFQTLLF